MSERETGLCDTCGREVELLANGNVRPHLIPDYSMRACPGGGCLEHFLRLWAAVIPKAAS